MEEADPIARPPVIVHTEHVASMAMMVRIASSSPRRESSSLATRFCLMLRKYAVVGPISRPLAFTPERWAPGPPPTMTTITTMTFIVASEGVQLYGGC